MEQNAESQEQLIIDVDIVIDKYNEKNPKLKPMDRKSLAEKIGCNKQVFSDWKTGSTPKLIYRLFKLMEVGKCDINDFIKPLKQ